MDSEEEDNIPVCDVFGEDAPWWSARYSGSNGRQYRGYLKWLEEMDPGYREFRSSCMSSSANKRYDKWTPEEREDHGKKISKGLSEMSEVSKEVQSLNLVSSFMGLPDTEREAIIRSRAEGQERYYRERSDEAAESRGNSISRGLNSRPEAEKKATNEAIGRATKARLAALTPEERLAYHKILSEAGKLAWKLLPDDIKETYTKARKDGKRSSSNTMTDPEAFVGIYLGKTFPDEWAYNGQCQKGCILGGKIPDFVNVNGSKAVVEVLGTYFHPEGDEELLISHYKALGYECIIVWEYDAPNFEELDKIFGIGV